MAEKISVRPSTITIKDGKILLVKSVYGNEQFYLFPGGGVEYGETIEKAAIRETLEETGFKVEIIKPAYINEYINLKNKSKRVINIFFLAKIKCEKPHFKIDDSGKLKAVEWIALEELRKIDLKPKFIKERLERDIKNNFNEFVYKVDYKNDG